MRLLLVLALILGPACHAQHTFFAAEVGPSFGDPGSGGPAARLQLGIGQVQGVTPTVRLASTSSTTRVSDDSERERDVTQGTIALGLSATRLVRVSQSVGVTGGLGIALAFASRSEEENDNAPIPGFNPPRLDAGLVLPLDLGVAVRLSDRVSLSAGGFWSIPLGSASSEDDPRLQEQLPGLGQAAAVVGVRVGRW